MCPPNMLCRRMGEVEVLFYPLVISALDKGGFTNSRSGRFTSWRGVSVTIAQEAEWVSDPLGTCVEKRKSLAVNPSAWSDGHCPHAARSHSFVYISTS